MTGGGFGGCVVALVPHGLVEAVQRAKTPPDSNGRRPGCCRPNRSTAAHHPLAFWSGTLAIVAGVLAHIPMFVCASHMGYQMAGMEMDAPMLAGMALIPLGCCWPPTA
jgi:hypothetical protein